MSVKLERPDQLLAFLQIIADDPDPWWRVRFPAEPALDYICKLESFIESQQAEIERLEHALATTDFDADCLRDRIRGSLIVVLGEKLSEQKAEIERLRALLCPWCEEAPRSPNDE